MLIAVAIVAALLMGFANHRGGTCTVAAIDEIITRGRYRRFAAIVEASLWVAGAVLVLRSVIVLPELPRGYSVGMATIVGGILFGIGAFISRACIFGSIARLGTGEWAFLATPVGFFCGAVLGAQLPGPNALTKSTFLLDAPIWLALVAGAAILGRLVARGREVRRSAEPRIHQLWSPHAATIVIGLTSLGGLLTAGAWTYSELLTDLAKGRAHDITLKVALNAALVAGALLGGWTSGRFKSVRPDLRTTVRTLLGGLVMGLGATLIPGGNAGLILVGIPLLWPYAWVAFATICLTIYAALRLSHPGRLRRRARSVALARHHLILQQGGNPREIVEQALRRGRPRTHSRP